MITQACDRKSSCVRAGRLAGISSKDTQDGVLAQAFGAVDTRATSAQLC